MQEDITKVAYGGAIENVSGAKMYISTATENTRKTEFIHNSADRGGALNNYGASEIQIGKNVDFISNTASIAGAAIFNETNSTITIGDNVNFSSNTAKGDKLGNYEYGGGAIWNNDKSILNIADCKKNCRFIGKF